MFFSRKREQFKNLISWLPIAWKDKDYDYGYLEDVIIFKLEKMYKFFTSEDCVSDSDVTVQQIKEVLDLLKKVQKDKYEEEIDPSFYNWIRLSVFVEGKDEEADKRMAIFWEAQKRKQEDTNKAYNLIAKNIQNWWD